MKLPRRSKTGLREVGLPLLAAAAGVGVGLFLKPGAGKPGRNRDVPQPAHDIDLPRYLGKWYELGRYENWFEKGGEAASAEYALLPDGKISVRNSCRFGGIQGKVKTSMGKARIVPGSGGAKLKVSFFGPFYIGNYWVLDRAEDYSWSIVGEPTGEYLWILARDAHLPEPERNMLFRRAVELGYDMSCIRPTLQ
jgi:apolipoprotein D and lipocalin family protein